MNPAFSSFIRIQTASDIKVKKWGKSKIKGSLKFEPTITLTMNPVLFSHSSKMQVTRKAISNPW